MLLCPWDSPGKNTGVGCHFLLHYYIYINQWQIYLRVKTFWSWFWMFFNYGKYLPLTLTFKCHHLTHPSQDSALIEYRKPNLMTAVLTVIYLLQRYSHRALRDVSIPLTNVFFCSFAGMPVSIVSICVSSSYIRIQFWYLYLLISFVIFPCNIRIKFGISFLSCHLSLHPDFIEPTKLKGTLSACFKLTHWIQNLCWVYHGYIENKLFPIQCFCSILIQLPGAFSTRAL